MGWNGFNVAVLSVPEHSLDGRDGPAPSVSIYYIYGLNGLEWVQCGRVLSLNTVWMGGMGLHQVFPHLLVHEQLEPLGTGRHRTPRRGGGECGMFWHLH